MSVDAAATLAQIIPVILLALTIEARLVPRKELRPWESAFARYWLAAVVLGLCLAEMFLMLSVIGDWKLPILVGGLTFLLISIGTALIVSPYVSALTQKDT